MKTIIAGSRLASKENVEAALLACPFASQITIVLCGEARGADTWGKAWANSKGIPVVSYLPDWEKYGKAAGPIRNQEMAKNADALILIWSGVSRGSASMLRIAEKHNLPIFEYKPVIHV